MYIKRVNSCFIIHFDTIRPPAKRAGARNFPPQNSCKVFCGGLWE